MNKDDSGSEAVLENAVKSSAAGEKEILSVENSDSDVVGATGTTITSVNVQVVKYGADPVVDVAGFVHDSNGGGISKGTVSVCLNDKVYATLTPFGVMGYISTQVIVTPGSYNLVLRYHDDSGEYKDCEYVYGGNPIVIASTWYVDGSKSSSGNGKSEANAFLTLREALDSANDGDKIKIAAGTYSGNGNTGVFIPKLLTFEKYGDGEAIFDGNGQSTIWSVGANSINISGLTFKNGHSPLGGAINFLNDVSNSVINATFINNTGIEYGGAIYVEGIVSKLTLNSTFINNTASINGGGIFIKGVTDNLSVYGEFRNNAADHGGAIYVKGQLSNSTINAKFINNTAGYGGAISVGATVSNLVINSIFENNVATGSGGAIYWFKVSDSLINSTFKNNSAERGGAIRFDGTFTKSNLTSVFINNIASEDGGANCFSSVNNVNIIGDFINNTAKGSGGKCGGGANAFYYTVTNVSISGNFIGNSATGSDATDGGAANYFFSGISNVNIAGKFINNTGNNVIYIFRDSGNNYIQDSVFLNNEVNHIINVTDGKITAKDNWFGNNYTNFMNEPENVGIDLVNWLWLAAQPPLMMEVGESSQITFELNAIDSNYNGYIYDASKMNITLDLSQTLGELDKTSALIGEKITYTAKKGGTATVTGKFETASDTVSFTINDSRIPTEISVANSTVDLKVNEEIAAGATLTPADAGNLTYNSSNSSVAVVENGRIKALAAGSANITVSFAGNDTYAAAQDKIIEVTVTLYDASVSVNNDTLNLLIDDEFTIVPTTTPEGLDVTFTPDDSGVVSVDEDGVVTALKNGTAVIKVSVGGDGVYALNTTDVTVTVKKIPTEIIANDTLDMKVDQIASNVASLNPSAAGNIIYYSMNPNVVKVEGSSIVAVGKGTALIVANFIGNDKYEHADSKFINVNVTKIETSITVGDDVDMKVGEIVEINATLTPADAGNLYCVSDNTSVFKVEGKNIIGVGKGTARLLVHYYGNDKYEAADSKIIVVTVALNDASVSVNNDTLNLLVKNTFDLEATTVPSGLNVSYSSTKESVVTVNSDGKVTAVGAGNATIVVTVGDDKVYAINSTNVSVNVKIPTAIDDIPIPVLRVGNKFTLRYILVDSNTGSIIRENLEYTVTSTNESVVKAYIDGGIVIECVGEGNANVTAGFAGNDKYAAAENKTFTLTVKKIPTEISVANSTVDLKVNDEIDAGASLTPANAGNVTYTSSDSSVAIVKDDKIIAVGEGSANITVSFAGDYKYAAAENKTITVNVSLNEASLSVDNSTLDLFVGDYYTLTVNTSPEGLNVTFTPDNSGVVSVENGTITALKEGEGSVRVSVGGDGVYELTVIDVTVTVKKIPTEISVENSTVDMKVNDEIDAGASLTPADAGNVSYTSSNSSVAVVEGGKIKALAEGSANITVSFAGDDKYATAENKTITVNVSLNEASLSVDNSTLDLFVGDYYTLTVNTYPEGLVVTFTPDNSGVVSVDENGKVTALKEGEGSVRVSVGGDGVYELTVIDVTVTVKKIPTEISVENSTVDMKVNDEIDAGASLTPADAGNVTYTSSNSSVAIVKDGKIIAVGEGSANITVSFAGDDTYATAENKTIEVTVNLRDASISVLNDTVSIVIDEVYQIDTVVVPENLTISYVSSNPEIASIDNGTVYGEKNGTAVITLTVGDDKVYKKVNATVTVTVSKVATEIVVNNATLDMHVGDVASDVASLRPFLVGNVTYTSSNSSVVKVEDDKLVAVGNGTAIVVVSYAGDDKYAAAESKNVTVTVTKVETSISVDVDNVDMKVGDNAKINANVTPADAGELDYTSSDVSVVTVNGIGELTAVGDGTAVITIRLIGDEKYAPVSKNITVTVSKKASKFAEVSIVRNNVTLILSDENGNPISGANITYTVNGVSNATVSDANGSFVIIGEAGAEIVVNYAENNVYLASNITINMIPQRQSTVIIGEDFTQYACDYYVGERGNNFTVQLTDADGNSLANKTVYIGYNGVTLNRTTDANGYANVQINLKNAGLYTFVVVFMDDDDYNATMKVFKVTINKKPTSISASAKTFKASAKTKKYTVTLKTIKGASIDGKTYLEAGKKVTLKINGKTYTAKTNAKGQATFSLKITKKGKFAAVIKYAGDNTYKSASKKVKITIK